MPRAGKFLNKKTTIYIIVAVIVIAVLAVYFYKKSNNSTSTPAANESPPQSEISFFKNAKTLTDKRTLAAAYEQNGQYDDSKLVWQGIADQSKQTNDYWALLNVCASHQVTGRQGCIKNTTGILESRLSKMDFQTAYFIGELLDSSGNGKLAILFYQRALSNYNPPQGTGANFPTKAQLQDKINELSA